LRYNVFGLVFPTEEGKGEVISADLGYAPGPRPRLAFTLVRVVGRPCHLRLLIMERPLALASSHLCQQITQVGREKSRHAPADPLQADGSRPSLGLLKRRGLRAS
jgi:hypothetical protein